MVKAQRTRAEELIEALGLRPHPEGGFYREVFRSAATVAPADDRGVRAALTTIYFLLTEGTHGRWHRVTSDEVWHLYEGSPLEILELGATGDDLTRHVLAPVGGGLSTGPVYTVPAGKWQAARPLGEYTLVGCTVGPGFDFSDFQLLRDDVRTAATIRAAWPDLASLI